MGAEYNDAKFKQVLHYIISKTESMENVGKTVLYKLLYFSDFNYYELYETMLTGESYRRFDHGPAPSHFIPAVEEMEKAGIIDEYKVNYYGHEQTRYHSLKKPDLSLLSADEIKHIDDTLGRYASMNANQIEALSHRDRPWMASQPDSVLDYELVFYRPADMSVRLYCDD